MIHPFPQFASGLRWARQVSEMRLRKGDPSPVEDFPHSPLSPGFFLPIFPDPLSPGCVACAGRGKCARCASGLLGMSFYALSEDRTRCINQAAQHFRIVLGLLAFVVVLATTYVFHLSRRPVTNAENVRYALRNHLEAKWAFAFGGLRHVV